VSPSPFQQVPSFYKCGLRKYGVLAPSAGQKFDSCLTALFLTRKRRGKIMTIKTAQIRSHWKDVCSEGRLTLNLPQDPLGKNTFANLFRIATFL
jgi:hypothetical protein